MLNTVNTVIIVLIVVIVILGFIIDATTDEYEDSNAFDVFDDTFLDEEGL